MKNRQGGIEIGWVEGLVYFFAIVAVFILIDAFTEVDLLPLFREYLATAGEFIMGVIREIRP